MLFDLLNMKLTRFILWNFTIFMNDHCHWIKMNAMWIGAEPIWYKLCQIQQANMWGLKNEFKIQFHFESQTAMHFYAQFACVLPLPLAINSN